MCRMYSVGTPQLLDRRQHARLWCGVPLSCMTHGVRGRCMQQKTLLGTAWEGGSASGKQRAFLRVCCVLCRPSAAHQSRQELPQHAQHTPQHAPKDAQHAKVGATCGGLPASVVGRFHAKKALALKRCLARQLRWDPGPARGGRARARHPPRSTAAPLGLCRVAPGPHGTLCSAPQPRRGAAPACSAAPPAPPPSSSVTPSSPPCCPGRSPATPSGCRGDSDARLHARHACRLPQRCHSRPRRRRSQQHCPRHRPRPPGHSSERDAATDQSHGG